MLVLVLVAPLPAEDLRGTYERALSLHQRGKLEEAVEAYGEVVELNAGHAGAWSNLGVALAALGRYEEAIGAYRRALEIVPGDHRIRRNLALAHYKANAISEAAEELASLHLAEPNDVRTTLLLADCRLRLGDFARVEDLLGPLEAAQPDNRALLYLLGMALVRGGKEEKGQRLVERLMAGGDTAEAHYLLGSAAFMARNYPQAVEEFSRAIALDPSLPSLNSYYGRALLFTGDAEGAESVLRDAVAADPNDCEVQYHLASILATLGRPRRHGSSRTVRSSSDRRPRRLVRFWCRWTTRATPSRPSMFPLWSIAPPRTCSCGGPTARGSASRHCAGIPA